VNPPGYEGPERRAAPATPVHVHVPERRQPAAIDVPSTGEAPRATLSPISVVMDHDESALEQLLRRVIREEAGMSAVAPSPRWRGGTLILRPGAAGLQEKTWPIETFFHKIVMIRNRLRTLEQQINASDLPDDSKLKLQAYISGCYGSLTSFNLLFADEADQFKGSGGD
jgi:hypothetical protein